VFVWSEIPGATSYKLLIEKDGAPFAEQRVDGAVTWTPAGLSFTAGYYQWTVQPWNQDGYGLKSDPAAFSVAVPMDEAPAVNSPKGNLQSGEEVEFNWAPLEGVRWYFLTIYKNGSVFATRYVDSATSWTPAFVFAVGDYQWTVQSWSPAGYGKPSPLTNFSVPGVTVPQSVSSVDTGQPEMEPAPVVRAALSVAPPALPSVVAESSGLKFAAYSLASFKTVDLFSSEVLAMADFYESENSPAELSVEPLRIVFADKKMKRLGDDSDIGNSDVQRVEDMKSPENKTTALARQDVEMNAARERNEGDASEALISSRRGYIIPIDVAVGSVNTPPGQTAASRKNKLVSSGNAHLNN
jgi:hypothetical protein